MPKLAKPTWFYVLEAAKEFNGKPFTSNDIIDKVQEKAPRAKKNTIICNLHGITPNNPSSKTVPSLLKNHAAFNYLGNGQFQMLAIEENRKKKGFAGDISIGYRVQIPPPALFACFVK